MANGVKRMTALKEGEHIEPLGNGISVIVSNENKFSTDTILLAHFSSPKKHERVLELGSGKKQPT